MKSIIILSIFCFQMAFSFIYPHQHKRTNKLNIINKNSKKFEYKNEFEEKVKNYKYEPYNLQQFDEEFDADYLKQINITELIGNIQNMSDETFEDILIDLLENLYQK